MFTSSAFSIYKAAVRTQFDKYAYPNWLPTSPVNLGDYGRVLTDGTFQRLGNIADLDIPIRKAVDSGVGEITFATAGELLLKPSADVKGLLPQETKGVAQATIKFTSRQAVFLKAIGVRGIHLDNYAEVGRHLAHRLGHRRWRTEYVVVTKLYQAEHGTIAIANTRRAGGEIDLQLSNGSDANSVNELLSAEIGLTITKARNVSFAGHFNTCNFLLVFSQLVTSTFSSQPVEFLPRSNRAGIFGGDDAPIKHNYPSPPTQVETCISLSEVYFN